MGRGEDGKRDVEQVERAHEGEVVPQWQWGKLIDAESIISNLEQDRPLLLSSTDDAARREGAEVFDGLGQSSPHSLPAVQSLARDSDCEPRNKAMLQ